MDSKDVRIFSTEIMMSTMTYFLHLFPPPSHSHFSPSPHPFPPPNSPPLPFPPQILQLLLHMGVKIKKELFIFSMEDPQA